MLHKFEHIIGDRTLTIEVGKLARQANAAATVSYGDTMVLATVCVSPEPREGTDFVPLTIDYEERLYAAGKIPGGFIRREGRPTEDATLASRLTDRIVRPLLSKKFHNDIQIIITVLSADQENDPDILAVIGASACLTMSSIPFSGPMAATRVGYLDGKFVLNPTLTKLYDSSLDLIVAGTRDAVVMVEAGAKEVSESLMVEAIKFGQQANQGIIELQQQLHQVCGKPKMEIPGDEVSSDLIAAIKPIIDSELNSVFTQPTKVQREEAMTNLNKDIMNRLGETFKSIDINGAFEKIVKAGWRASILKNGNRWDGRSFRTVRPISCETGILPRPHGSGLFTRGQTQVLTVTTLASMRKEQPLDGIGPEEKKHFMHHYNFPSYSNGEVKRMGSPGRREIGHGALAERALLPVLPDEGNFPYTIRLVSEVLSSAGSTSMASACSSSLSLMDAGVPIRVPVAGIAMGLVTGDNGNYAVLTDIEGWEDAYGDMDFKIAGTTDGITAIQMDIKLQGIPHEILEAAIYQAREARLEILEIMQRTIGSSRPELSHYAPRIYRISIDPTKIGSVIGPGGKTIRSITEETKASVDVENDGTVIVGSPNEESAQRAIQIIESLTREIESGGIYNGKVTRIFNFGAMVEIIPGKEGLVHISELADYRVPNVEDVVQIGDEIMVKVIEIDRMGRINLSRRAVYNDQPQMADTKERDSRGGAGSFTRKPSSNRPFHRPRSGSN